MSRVAVIGEALVDVVHGADGSARVTPGGSAANVAVTLGRQGVKVTLLTCVGADEAGASVRAWLAGSHVSVSPSVRDRTSTAVASLDSSGSATYTFDMVWDPDHLDVGDAAVVHVGSVAALLAPGADRVLAAVRAARPTALITYDPNVRPALLGDPADHLARVEDLVALADVVKVSDEDLRWLYPADAAIEVATRWQRNGPAIVVVTRGADGADAIMADGVRHVVGSPVTVVDTVGAGDTFMGTIIAFLLARGFGTDARRRLTSVTPADVHAMLAESARAAAVTVSRPGADPPWAAELVVA
ncbi:carbohydrate kinase family protein [Microbacterium sp. PA5]|uniref:carbohydrate kinase family protein n=1 Tax=Microbacterium sp. PA5 TaxID=3416654 RepID=UPI003CF7C38D